MKKLLSLFLTVAMACSLAVTASAAEEPAAAASDPDLTGSIVIQGDPTVSASQGETAVELMNLAGYDAAALGNHEFDYGYDNLVKLSRTAKFPILSANTLYNGKTAFGDNKIFTAPNGTKIGVFGLETPETATKASLPVRRCSKSRRIRSTP